MKNNNNNNKTVNLLIVAMHMLYLTDTVGPVGNIMFERELEPPPTLRSWRIHFTLHANEFLAVILT